MPIRACLLAIGTLLAMSCGAQSTGNLADIAIIDRETGAALRTYYHRGEYWVAGTPGARYAIEIHNHLGERVLAVTSVDGVNVLSGADAAWDQGGYVFDGGARYQITGWRKSDSEIAAFTFTASPNSYAERTGRMANVGIIGIALFRERPPVLSYVPRVTEQPPAPPRPAAADSAPAPAASLAAPSAAARALAPPAALAEVAPPQLAAPKLGTGHGEREYSYVDHTAFTRLQTQPNEVIRFRYDSFDNLVAMGIVRRPPGMPPTLNPFPASQPPQYVPDPPG
jgi:hypothetical protein